MAFDWTKVEGYKEEMTAEEKLELLNQFEMPEATEKPDLKGFIPKAQFDKLASDFASVKKQLKTKMTEEEQKDMDRQAADEAMKQELEALRRDKTIGNYTANYLAQGYEPEVAAEAATALADGDMDTVFNLMKKAAATNEKNLRAKILKDTPVPPAGADPTEEQKKKKEQDDLRRAFGLPVK